MQAKAVFWGTTTGKADISGWWWRLRWVFGLAPSTHGMQYTFAVQTSWKGVTTTEVTVITGYGRGDCGVVFDMGQQYVIYAFGRRDGGLGTNICTRTAKAAHGSRDLSYLRTLPALPLQPASLPLR